MKAADPEQGKQKLLDEIRMNVRSFLDGDGDSVVDGDAPFCYWLGPTNCHRKWIAGSGKELWGINPDDLKGKLPPYLPDVEIVRQDVADYLGEAQAFDAALGVLLEELKRVGKLEDTLLVVSGDHGIPGVTRGKCNLYDLGTNVPLAIHWPGGISSTGRVVTDFVSLPDLAPTFLEAAGLEPPDAMTSRSLLPILAGNGQGRVDPARDAVFTGRERHVAKARAGFKPYPQRAIRTDQYLFIIITSRPTAGRWEMGQPRTRKCLPSKDSARTPSLLTAIWMPARPRLGWSNIATKIPPRSTMRWVGGPGSNCMTSRPIHTA